nr:MAG TPA: hypothetical protein [Caudoviricetes sp.]
MLGSRGFHFCPLVRNIQMQVAKKATTIMTSVKSTDIFAP